jgi:hypothetical protein
MANADPEIADPSVRGVCITEPLTGRTFAAASLYAATECAERRALTNTGDVYVFSLIFYKLIIHKGITKSDQPGRFSLMHTAPRQSANSWSSAAAKSPTLTEILPS